MGYPPELPDGNENHFNTIDENIINYAQNTSEDSDNNEDNNIYEGYQPIPFGEQGEELDIDTSINDDDDIPELETNEDPNLPNIISTDVEVEHEVWNRPRPKELEIELDTSKTEQIIAAMATITLPTSAIPEWARDISEDKWKDTLLERIRQRKEVLNGTSSVSET